MPPPLPGAPRPSSTRTPESPLPAVVGKVRVGPGVGMGQVMRVGDPSPVSKDGPPSSGPDIKVEPASQSDMWPSDAEGDDRTPSSLEAAVIREISDRTPEPGPPPTDAISTIVDASELKARALAATVASDPPRATIPSLPPDAVVPASPSEDRIKTSELATTGIAASDPCAAIRRSAGRSRLLRLLRAAAPRAASRRRSIWLFVGALGLLVAALAGYLDRYVPELGDKKPAEPAVSAEAPQPAVS